MQGRDVLELVDHEASVSRAEFFCDFREVFHRAGNVEQEVVEVEKEAFGCRFNVFVDAVCVGNFVCRNGGFAVELFDAFFVVGDGDQPGFGPFDFADDVADDVFPGFNSGVAECPGHHTEFVVEDSPRQVAGYSWPEVGKLFAGCGVECSCLDCACPHDAEALSHFFGGFGGKGDGVDLLWSNKSLIDQVGNAMGNRARFTRPCSGDDGEGASWGCCRFVLVGIEFLE